MSSTALPLYRITFTEDGVSSVYFKAEATPQKAIDQAAAAYKEEHGITEGSFNASGVLEAVGEITLEHSAEFELQQAVFGLLYHIVEMGAQNLVDGAPGSPYAVARDLLTDEQKAILEVDEEARS